MALIMATNAQAQFYEKLFGPTHPTTQKVKALLAAGAQFTVSLYTLYAKYQGTSTNLNLTHGTTALMKGAAPEIVAQNWQLIEKWVDDLYAKLPSTPAPEPPASPEPPTDLLKLYLVSSPPGKTITVIKALRTVTGMQLIEAKTLIENTATGPQLVFTGAQDKVLEKAGIITATGAIVSLTYTDGKPYGATAGATDNTTTYTIYDGIGTASTTSSPPVYVSMPMKAQPVPQVLHLRDAKALGQKVHGTSSGSVYYCVAYNERVRVAARIYKAGSISIRAEWDKALPAELKKLEDAGLGMKSNYASMHMNAGTVPPGRVIGAFVVGTGIKWQEVVTNADELVIEG